MTSCIYYFDLDAGTEAVLKHVSDSGNVIIV